MSFSITGREEKSNRELVEKHTY